MRHGFRNPDEMSSQVGLSFGMLDKVELNKFWVPGVNLPWDLRKTGSLCSHGHPEIQAGR